jgi:hypothetical protein
MQRRGSAELHLRPFEIANLDGAQAVPEGNQDQGGIAMAVTVALATLTRRSTSRSVRCSRSRPMSRLLGRRSVTVRNSESGATSRRLDLAMILAPARKWTGLNLTRLRTVFQGLDSRVSQKVADGRHKSVRWPNTAASSAARAAGDSECQLSRKTAAGYGPTTK